jgi:hypothetical protein
MARSACKNMLTVTAQESKGSAYHRTKRANTVEKHFRFDTDISVPLQEKPTRYCLAFMNHCA